MTNLPNILFLDIETVPMCADFNELNEDWKSLWRLKAKNILNYFPDHTEETLYGRAGIYAEFGKVVCISCGAISDTNNKRVLNLTSFWGDDEKEILIAFKDRLLAWSKGKQKQLCAHNGKEFDFPYLCRRMIVNQISIPSILDIAGKKPWEIPHLDTMDLWKFGDYKHFTSLNLLSHLLNIPTPKDEIDGSKVNEIYWKQKDLKKIVTYCEKDVLALTNIFLRMNNEKLIDEARSKL